jgi:hypothetical protein
LLRVKDGRADGIDVVGYGDNGASEVNTSGGLDAVTVGLEDGSEEVDKRVGVVDWNSLGEVVVGKIEGKLLGASVGKLLGAFVGVLVIVSTSVLEEPGGDFFVVVAKRDISYLP